MLCDVNRPFYFVCTLVHYRYIVLCKCCTFSAAVRSTDFREPLVLLLLQCFIEKNPFQNKIEIKATTKIGTQKMKNGKIWAHPAMKNACLSIPTRGFYSLATCLFNVCVCVGGVFFSYCPKMNYPFLPLSLALFCPLLASTLDQQFIMTWQATTTTAASAPIINNNSLATLRVWRLARF